MAAREEFGPILAIPECGGSGPAGKMSLSNVGAQLSDVVLLNWNGLFEILTSIVGALDRPGARTQTARRRDGRHRWTRDRRASAREVIESPGAGGKGGFPPSITADAQLGYSVMACQSGGILPESCVGDGSIFVRLEGHSGAKNELGRRARVGFCPCCTQATHSAVPSRYTVGGFPSDRAHGLQLLRERGPRTWSSRVHMVCSSHFC